MSFYAGLRPLAGARTVDVDLPDGSTVRQLLDALARERPALGTHLLDACGRLSRHVHLFVDGRSVRYLERGLETPLCSAHKLDIFPAVAGGAGRPLRP